MSLCWILGHEYTPIQSIGGIQMEWMCKKCTKITTYEELKPLNIKCPDCKTSLLNIPGFGLVHLTKETDLPCNLSDGVDIAVSDVIARTNFLERVNRKEKE